MSICFSCKHIDKTAIENYCLENHSPINGDCEWFKEVSALDIQVAGDHYKKLQIQPIEYCQKNQLNCCESKAIKYVTRHRFKNGLEDINKAIHILNILKELVYIGNTTIPLYAKQFVISPEEYCKKNKLNYYESKVVIYVSKHTIYNGVDDINKAIHNLELLKEMEYE